MKASTSLIALSGLVRAALPPGLDRDGKPDHAGMLPRRDHAADTLKQLAGWLDGTGVNLSLAEFGVAYETLAYPRSKDGRIRNRQQTCAQLAALCKEQDGEPAYGVIANGLLRATSAWSVWMSRCDSSDPRQAAMRATFEREHARLVQEVITLESQT